MVDTLVLGTSANAWEFESLHAQAVISVRVSGRFFCIFMAFGVSENCYKKCNNTFRQMFAVDIKEYKELL